MKKLFILLITLCPLAFAQPAPAAISEQLHSFSPMVQIYLKHLALADKNSNGIIDKGAGEGYEAFAAKYGNADVGFYANGITQNANNGRLEEPEIINHYYISIRFKPDFQKETASIESEVKEYIYANNIPLVWLDDKQGTVMNAVNNILGKGWNERKVTENEAVELFNRVMSKLYIFGRSDDEGEDPYKTGYYTLPELIIQREGYCFEVAQFGFWFFSQLEINSLQIGADLTRTTSHVAVRLCNSGRIVDYFMSSYLYRNVKWNTESPLYSISDYDIALAKKNEPSANNRKLWEDAVIYNKYDIANVGFLMKHYYDSNNPDYREIIALGEFILQNTNVNQIMNLKTNSSDESKNNIKALLIMLVVSYSTIRDHNGFDNVSRLLNQYFRNEQNVREFIDYYRF